MDVYVALLTIEAVGTFFTFGFLYGEAYGKKQKSKPFLFFCVGLIWPAIVLVSIYEERIK